MGVYQVILTVRDAFDFESSQTFEVNIKDTTAPEVTLNASLDTIYVGSTYVDQSIIYDDLSDVTTEITNNINVEVAGIYVINYEVMDAYGNQTLMKRYVHVVENDFVVFHMTPSLSTLRVGETFINQGCYATHLNVRYECELDLTELNHLVVGDYEITYSVTILGKTYVRSLYVFIVERDYKQEEAILLKNKGEFL